MWLPETAVDSESLELLAEEGIAFTILSPYQADSVLGSDGHWADVSGGSVDTRRAYRVDLPNERAISVFFYDGPLSQEIAFNGVLDDGRILAKRLVQAIGEGDGRPLLAHVATDGETYGHHHRHGEMALAAAIADLEQDQDVNLTNYASFLEQQPASSIARIVESSSWSCAHGVERWRADCGCHSGAHPDWSQTWRAPLRVALDRLRDSMIEIYEARGGDLLSEPWAARDAYIDVILGGPVDDLISEHGSHALDPEERSVAVSLLEAQHQAMLMYTSCGWFFDDVSGIEAVLVLRYAGRAIYLTRQATGVDLEPVFLEILETAPSNVDGKSGRDVYQEKVSPYMAI
jgi:alpha-amylase/alpha-mannosidase (GH57 family)